MNEVALNGQQAGALIELLRLRTGAGAIRVRQQDGEIAVELAMFSAKCECGSEPRAWRIDERGNAREVEL